MPNFDYKPKSSSTDPAQVIRDMTERFLRQGQREGTAPATLGVTRPLPPINNAVDSHRAMENWAAEQRATYGGQAADSRTTPVQEGYAARRYAFISREEAIRDTAYDDATGRPVQGKAQGNVTVGIGFNMDRGDAPKVFAKVLGIQGKAYNDIYTGKAGLSPTQIRKLFDYSAEEAEVRVAKVFQGVDLKEHQRLALVSMALNAPTTIGPRLAAAVKAGDTHAAVKEVLYNSGAIRDPRLKGRREREAMMLAGHANASDLLRKVAVSDSDSGPSAEGKALQRAAGRMRIPVLNSESPIRSTSGTDEPGIGPRPPMTEDRMPDVPIIKPRIQA